MEFKHIIWNWIKKKYRIRSKDLLIAKYRLKIGKILYKKKFNTGQLLDHLSKLGLRKGAVVLIHSSWDEFYNYTGTINDFIDGIINYIGKEGTLLMPAYPLLRKPNSVFDICKTPTVASLIAEEFRNYPGVKRSVNIHSVCALGPLSDYLINEHHLSVTSWDEKSPYYKLANVNGIVLTFGLGKYFVGTTMHCADSILREESPYFAQFFTKKITYKFRLQDDSIYEQECLIGSDDFRYFFTDKSHNRFVSSYFDKTKYKKTRLSNLTINYYDADHVISRTIQYGRIGKTVYLKPKWINSNN
jgi:aminoglycoside N3'-acetyltransferase